MGSSKLLICLRVVLWAIRLGSYEHMWRLIGQLMWWFIGQLIRQLIRQFICQLILHLSNYLCLGIPLSRDSIYYM